MIHVFDPNRFVKALGLAGLFVLSARCAEHRGAGVPPAQSTATTTPPAAAVASASASGDPGRATAADVKWAEAVRLERWAEAAQLLDALPEADRARPEIRFVRARAALARGEAGRALELLTGLERDLPLLASDVTRLRAEAAFEAGPYADAAAYFARSSKAREVARAAAAYDKAGDSNNARRFADRAVQLAQKSKSRREEAAARLARATVLAGVATGPAKAQAIADYRWVAMHPTATDDARQAAEALDRLGQPLSTKERMQAIDLMNESGHGADALKEIDRLSDRPDAPRSELLHAKAVALYSTRDFDLAAKTFQDAAQTKSGREPEQRFLAARALARAERDDEAIKAFQDVAARWPKTFFSERATYLAARLMLQNARFKEAAALYAKYQLVYPKGEKRDEARYERTLALLSSDNPKTARSGFAALAKAAHGDDVGRLRELEGVAALRAGERDDAIRIWSDVIKSYPLTWSALMARARLASIDATPPPLLEPGSPRTAAPLELKLPPTASLLVSIGLDGDAETFLAANEHEAAASFAGRESEALCGMYGMLVGAKRRYRVATYATSPAMFAHAPGPAERWTWECFYPRPYPSYVSALEQQHGLPKGLVTALIRQESAFDPAIASPAGAVGLMQLLPSTAHRAAAEMGIDIDGVPLERPELNLRLGAFYIAKLIKMFDGSPVLAIASYNAGPKAVSHWLEGGGATDADADLWVARIPYEETRNYVGRVMANHAHYEWLEGGQEALDPIALALPTTARAPADAY